MSKRELMALLFCWLMIVVWLFLEIPQVCLQFMIVVVPDHTHSFDQNNDFRLVLQRPCFFVTRLKRLPGMHMYTYPKCNKKWKG